MRRCVRGSNAPHRKYTPPAGSTHTKLNVLWVTPTVLLQHAGGTRVRLLHSAGTRRILLLSAGYTHHMVTRVCRTRCGSHRLAIEWAPRQLFSATRSESESYIAITGSDVCVDALIECQQAVPPLRLMTHVRVAHAHTAARHARVPGVRCGNSPIFEGMVYLEVYLIYGVKWSPG